MHPRSQERDAFQQACDVRVIAVSSDSRSRPAIFRMRRRELAAPERGSHPVHGRNRVSSASDMSRDLSHHRACEQPRRLSTGSTTVSKAIGSGAGSACRTASMRSRNVASWRSSCELSLTRTERNRGSNRRMVSSISRRSTSRSVGVVKSGPGAIRNTVVERGNRKLPERSPARTASAAENSAAPQYRRAPIAAGCSLLLLARSARHEPVRALRRSAGRAAEAVRAAAGAVPHCHASERARPRVPLTPRPPARQT